jgi:hypothetical protein
LRRFQKCEIKRPNKIKTVQYLKKTLFCKLD